MSHELYGNRFRSSISDLDCLLAKGQRFYLHGIGSREVYMPVEIVHLAGRIIVSVIHR